MSNDEVRSLLADATLLLTYAVRAGRLRDDALPNVIKEVETSLNAGNTPSLAPLSRAINDTVSLIAPVTLVDLRAGRSPFNRDGLGPTWLQYGLCCLTVVLAALIAFYSFAVQRKEGALREYQEVRTANIPEKFIALYRMSQETDVKNRKDPRYEQYQRSLNEIQNLNARNQTAVNLLIDQSQPTKWPFQGEILDTLEAIAPWLSKFFGDKNVEADLSQTQNLYDDMCAQPPPAEARPTAGKLRPVTWQQVVSRENYEQSCFKQMTGIHYGIAIEAASLLYTANIRDNIVLLSVWILPFLSGLLGATIYLLRDSLTPLTPNFGLTRGFVRLALGGVAGIIIGWFWLPSGTFGIEGSRGSPVPMALSFITGFSIDILFTALDRLKATLTAAQEGPKGPPK